MPEDINQENINVTKSQKEIIVSFFKDDIDLIEQYSKKTTSPINKDFRYYIFHDYIFAASDMIRSLDLDFYNEKLFNQFKLIKNLDNSYQNFKAKSKHVLTIYVTEFLCWQEDYVLQKKIYEDMQKELKMLIASEIKYTNQFKKIQIRINELKAKKELDQMPQEEQDKIKLLRKEHVDVIHLIGERRKQLDRLQELLENFEEAHKALFKEYFKSIKDQLDSQYNSILDYFGYKFNKKVFTEANISNEIQKFKLKAGIRGDICLCKYFEYHIKNISTDELSDPNKKECLTRAKQYCKNQREREDNF